MKNIFVKKSYTKYGGKEAGGVWGGGGGGGGRWVGKTTCLPTMVVASCDLV